jgi:hypothetical protein
VFDSQDQDFEDVMNPSGGQFSSLADLANLMRTLLNTHQHPLNASAPGPLARSTVARWLRPAHAFEEDDWTETGLIWEIVKHVDSFGRRRRIYQKRVFTFFATFKLSLMGTSTVGNLNNFHTAFSLHPGSSYGVIVLTAGARSIASELAYDAFDIFQPVIDTLLSEAVTAMYAGKWRSEDGHSEAVVVVEQGTLWVNQYVLEGVDVITVFADASLRSEGKLALREVGTRDEFRCALQTFYSFDPR